MVAELFYELYITKMYLECNLTSKAFNPRTKAPQRWRRKLPM